MSWSSTTPDVVRSNDCRLGRCQLCIMDSVIFLCYFLWHCQLTKMLSTWELGSVYDRFWGRLVVFYMLYDDFWEKPVVFCVIWMVRSDSMRFHTNRTNLNRGWQLQTIVSDRNWCDFWLMTATGWKFLLTYDNVKIFKNQSCKLKMVRIPNKEIFIWIWKLVTNDIQNFNAHKQVNFFTYSWKRNGKIRQR